MVTAKGLDAKGVSETGNSTSVPQREPAKSRTMRDPERSRLNLIKAATVEFSARGFEGARVDEIASRANASKQLVYHYFKSKDDLYTAVLEDAYARLSELRSRGLSADPASLDPIEAIRNFVSVTLDSFLKLPDVIALIADENFHKAAHVRRSEKIKSIQSRLEGHVRTILERGETQGVFRKGVDPLRLFISVLGLCSFFVSNRYTLSAIYGRNLSDPEEAELWRAHIVELVCRALQSSG